MEEQCFAVREVGNHHTAKIVHTDRRSEMAGSRRECKDSQQEHTDSLQVALVR
jgi:hypothetical protein